MDTTVPNPRPRGIRLYLQFFAILFILTTIILYSIAISGCDDCGNNNGSGDSVDEYSDAESVVSYEHTASASYQAEITLYSNTIYKPGYSVLRRLEGRTLKAPGPTKVTFKYYPPDGATQFTTFIIGGMPPDNPDGPAPYIWKDRSPYFETTVQFVVPGMPSDTDEMTLVETLEAWYDNAYSAAIVKTTITRVTSDEYEVKTNTTFQPGGVAPKSDGMAWHIAPWVQVKGITMTTSLCQDWLDFMQGDNAFAAVRLPMYTSSATRSYTMPVIFNGACSPTLKLANDPYSSPVITAGVELRPGRSTFLANNFPNAQGETWLAMGVSGSGGVCPTMGDKGPGSWLLNFSGCLDLPYNPLGLPVYFCVEGNEQPLMSQAQMAALKAASALGADIGVSTYPEEGVTCVGPYMFHLHTTGDLSLYNWSSLVVTPTQLITFNHAINVSYPMTVTLDYASNLGAPWTFYTAQGPVLQPVTGPIWVNYFESIWAASQVPGNASGAYSLLVTATAQMTPTLYDFKSDLMWAGKWVAPPPPPPGPVPMGDLYLPLVYKETAQPVVAPDLVVEKLTATGNDVQVVIGNHGTGPAVDDFWVDVYVDPDPAPTHVNQEWYNLADQGLVWGVIASNVPIDPGEVITLTVADVDYSLRYSHVNWPIPAGTPIYAHVDSVNLDTDYGGVLETHEILGEPYNNITSSLSTVGAGDAGPLGNTGGSTDSEGNLPRR